jgi:hypothetical protein
MHLRRTLGATDLDGARRRHFTHARGDSQPACPFRLTAICALPHTSAHRRATEIMRISVHSAPSAGTPDVPAMSSWRPHASYHRRPGHCRLAVFPIVLPAGTGGRRHRGSGHAAGTIEPIDPIVRRHIEAALAASRP